MCRIAALITDLFEDEEYLQPTNEFQKAGHMLENIGLTGGRKVNGLASHTVFIDRDVRDASSRNYDALFIPGGYSADKLRANDNVISMVREFMSREKPVFAICHGLQLLISACMLAGRRVAGRKSLAQDIANAGGILSDRRVMVDGALITCSSDEDLPAFINACLQKLSTEQ
jgi:protease I